LRRRDAISYFEDCCRRDVLPHQAGRRG
jgi:hypothetical protein